MNIGEGNDVNLLLSYLAGRRADPYDGRRRVTAAEARAAAERLADKAYKVLMAGWTAERLRMALLHQTDLQQRALPDGLSPTEAEAEMLAGFRGDRRAEPTPLRLPVVLCGCGVGIIHATADGYGRDGCDDPTQIVPDPEHCGVESEYGECHRPPHHDGELHATIIGGGGDPFGNDPQGWFQWGEGATPGYVWASIGHDATPTTTPPAGAAAA